MMTRATMPVLLAGALVLTACTPGATSARTPDDGATGVGSQGATVVLADGAVMKVPAGAVPDGSEVLTGPSSVPGLAEPWFTAAGSPLDLDVSRAPKVPVIVEFSGTRTGMVPVVLHHVDGDWLPIAFGTPTSPAVAQTSQFSPYQFGWVEPNRLLTGVSEPISRWTRDILGKRSTAPTCSKAPEWVQHQQSANDVTLTCVGAEAASGRTVAELKVVNNRGYAIEAPIPDKVVYAAVSGQPEPLRAAVRSIAGDRDVVWLMPGQTLRLAFEQPERGRQVVLETPFTAPTIVVGVVNGALDDATGTLAVFALKDCTAWSQLPLNLVPDEPGITRTIGAAIACFQVLAAQPARLLSVVQQLTPNAPADKLAANVKKLRFLAGALTALDAGADVIDLVADDYVSGGGAPQLDVSLASPQATRISTAPCSQPDRDRLVRAALTRADELSTVEVCQGTWLIAVAPKQCPDCPKEAEALQFRQGRWISRFYLPGELCADALAKAGAPAKVVQAWPSCGNSAPEQADASLSIDQVAARWYEAVRRGDTATAGRYEASFYVAGDLSKQELDAPFTCSTRKDQGSCLAGHKDTADTGMYVTVELSLQEGSWLVTAAEDKFFD